jgi:hypothetical protein
VEQRLHMRTVAGQDKDQPDTHHQVTGEASMGLELGAAAAAQRLKSSNPHSTAPLPRVLDTASTGARQKVDRASRGPSAGSREARPQAWWRGLGRGEGLHRRAQACC